MNTHSTDIVSLVAGLAFAALAAVGLALGAGYNIDLVTWVWPGLLIGLGLIVLVATGLRGDRADASPDEKRAAPDPAAGSDVQDDVRID